MTISKTKPKYTKKIYYYNYVFINNTVEDKDSYYFLYATFAHIELVA